MFIEWLFVPIYVIFQKSNCCTMLVNNLHSCFPDNQCMLSLHTRHGNKKSFERSTWTTLFIAFLLPFSFQVTNIQGEAITVECLLPIMEGDPARFYLEDAVMVHANRLESFACPMTELSASLSKPVNIEVFLTLSLHYTITICVPLHKTTISCQYKGSSILVIACT